MLDSLRLSPAQPHPEPRVPRPVSVLRTVADLDEEAAVWSALAVPSESPTRLFAWTRAAASTLLAEPDLHVLSLTAGTSRAFLPLSRSRDNVTNLETLGSPLLDAPADGLWSDRAAAGALADAVLRLDHRVTLTRCPADSLLVQCLERLAGPSRVVSRFAAAVHPTLALDPTWREPERHFSARRRGRVNYAREAAAARGDLTHGIIAPSNAALPGWLDGFAALEMKRRNGIETAASRALQAFDRELAGLANRDRLLRVAHLSIDGQPIAMQLALEYGHRLWLLRSTFDPAYSTSVPVTLLQIETIRWAALRDLQSFEFLNTDESIARKWSAHLRPCVRVQIA